MDDDYLEMVNEVTLPTSGYVTLSFDKYQDLDCGEGAQSSLNHKIVGLAHPVNGLPNEEECTIDDKLVIEISTDNGSTWDVLAELENSSSGWITETLLITDYLGQNVKIRFLADVKDGLSHKTLGWMIDNVFIKTVSPTLPTFFFEDFEASEYVGAGIGTGGEEIWRMGVENWSLQQGSGANCPPPAPNNSTVIYFGNDSDCSYTSIAQDHLKMINLVGLPPSITTTLSFDSYEDFDCSPCSDKPRVKISTDDGVTWDLLAELDNNGAGWTTENLSLADYAGELSIIKFEIDQANPGSVTNLGWMIDNVALRAEAASGGDSTVYTWDFGDGNPTVDNGAVITHTYATAGDYTAIVTATGGLEAQTLVTIQTPPAIDVTPVTLTETMDTNSSQDIQLTISNVGQGHLTWDIILNQPQSTFYTWLTNDNPEGPDFNWLDISATGTQISGLGVDNHVGPFPISFDFPYFGQNYDEFFVGSNGIIGFGPPDNYGNPENAPLPSPGEPNNIIAWFWTTLQPGSGTVHYQEIDNQLIIQFTDYEWRYSVPNTSLTAQVILKPNGQILIQYLSLDPAGTLDESAIGIENQAGRLGFQAAYGGTFATANMALEFTPSVTWLAIDLMNGTTPEGQNSSITLTIDTTALISGTYQANIIIRSNDPLRPEVIVPLTLNVLEDPIEGLTLTDSGLTRLGNSTVFTAAITAGDNVEYSWNFGDGSFPLLTQNDISNQSITDYLYLDSGTYTVVVTAANSISTASVTTSVTAESPLLGLSITHNSPTILAQATTLTATATISVWQTLFFEDFEPPLEEFDWEGFGYPNGEDDPIMIWWIEDYWNLEATDGNCPPPLPHNSTVAYLGDDDTCIYDVDYGESLALDGDMHVTLPPAGEVYLTFDSYQDIDCVLDESGGPIFFNIDENKLDTSKITGLASPQFKPLAEEEADCTFWLRIYDYSEEGQSSIELDLDNNDEAWSNQRIPIPSQHLGKDVVIVFDFVNDFSITSGFGWMIDNIDLRALVPATATNGISYTWDFDDGSPIVTNGAVITHIYPSVGHYTPLVTANNIINSLTATTDIMVDEQITGLTASNNSPSTLGQTTDLSATVISGTNITYSWDFDDGNIGSGASVSHPYSALGIYTATITATNSVSLITATTVVTIVDVPITGLTAANNSPTAADIPPELVVTITAGTNVSYNWDFGDNTSALTSSTSLTHAYQMSGAYTAMVTASNSANEVTATTSVIIPGPVDAEQSSITVVGPDRVGATGLESINLRVTARDALGYVIPGAVVTLTSVSPVSFTQPALTNGSGQTTGSLTSTQVGVYEIGANIDGIQLTDSEEVSFEGVDLSVAQAAENEITAGYPLTYYISLSNEGYFTATNVVLTDTLPAGATFFSSSSAYTYTISDDKIVWEIGDLGRRSDVETLDFTVVVTAPSGGFSSITNLVEVTGDELELNLSNNSSFKESLIIDPVPLLSVTPLYPTLPVTQGHSSDLIITVHNAGTATMTDTKLFTPSFLASWVTLSQTDLGDILAGQSVEVTLTAAASNISQRGHYRDLIEVTTAAGDSRNIYLDVHVRGQTRDLQLTLNNDLGNLVAGGSVTLKEEIMVVTQGATQTVPYYRYGVTDGSGQLPFMALENNKYYDFDIAAEYHLPKSAAVSVTVGTTSQAWPETLTAQAGLTVAPDPIEFNMARGSLARQQLVLHNPGLSTLNNIQISTPSQLPWVYLGKPSNTSIPPGEYLTVEIYAAPTLTETAGTYQYNIDVTAAGGHAVSPDLNINLNGGLLRTMCLTIETNSGGPLTQGTVRLEDLNGKVVSSSSGTETVQHIYVEATDVNGQVCFPDLEPGPYLATVGSGEQRLGTKSIEVVPGVGNQTENMDVSDPSITVNWSVVPTLIEDRYTTVLTMTFIPEAPPRLGLYPQMISICDLVTPASNGEVTETVTIHNFYPITFTNAKLNMETFGEIKVTLTKEDGTSVASATNMDLGDIGPNQSVNLTLHAELDPNDDECLYGDAGAVQIKVSADYEHYISGKSWINIPGFDVGGLPLNDTSYIPLKLTNSGYPAESNLHTPPQRLKMYISSSRSNYRGLQLAPPMLSPSPPRVKLAPP